MDRTQFLEFVNDRRNRLVEREPDLRHYFVNIFLREFNCEVPFLPIRCFRRFPIFSGDLPYLGSVSDVFCFLSSGSTNDIRGRHYVTPQGLRTYAQGAGKGFEDFLNRFGFAKTTPLVSLVPPSSDWPHSSLAAMIGMFAEQGFDVRYCDVEGGLADLSRMLKSVGDEAIIFGTSFHHVWVHRHRRWYSRSLFAGKRLLVVDTGGTKGRTEFISPHELAGFARRAYGEHNEFLFLSEYGMCELASQAWSVQSPHDGVFACNASLTAVAVDLDSRAQVETGRNGFLGFLDENNLDSFPCIITEDIGSEISPVYEGGCSFSGFRLQGRAPDASLKGCSLNVKEANFLPPRFTKYAFMKKWCRWLPTKTQDDIAPSAFSAGLWERVLSRLPREVWCAESLADLKNALEDWNSISHLHHAASRNVCRKQWLQIVASANIPITWVHPVAAAAWLGYEKVHLNLPTMRADDPISILVLAQIESLVAALESEFAPLKIHIHKSRVAHPDELAADVIVVFGSDSTCRIFSESAQRFRTQVLPFGDIWNSARVDEEKHSPEKVAQWCASWLGRGCLTPIILFVSEGRISHRSYVRKLSEEMDRLMACSAEGANDAAKFVHRHDLLDVVAALRKRGIESERAIVRGKYSWIVDCTSFETRMVDASELPLRSGGSGLVFLLPGHQKENAELKWLGEDLCQPRLGDRHMGKTWFEWLSVHLDR